MTAIPNKWRFAIGTTSRVPGYKWHYLILDYDNVPFSYVFHRLVNRFPCIVRGGEQFQFHAQPTQSGWHVFTSIHFYYFEELIDVAYAMGADPAWLRIGEKRGYLFLADKAPVPLPWPVERMVIAREQVRRGCKNRFPPAV